MKAGVGYTFGNILLQCMGVFTLPLYTRLLSASEYGYYAIFMSYASILLTVVSCALHTSVRSAKIEFGDKVSEYVSSVIIVYFINFSILLAISSMASKELCRRLGLNNGQLILLSIYSCCTSIINLYNTRLSLNYSVKKFIKLAAMNSIVSLMLSLTLMFTVFSDDRLQGRFLGTTAAVGIAAVIALCSLFKQAKPKLDKEYLSFGLRYSMPLIAHGIAQTLLAQFDRIMINSIVGVAEAGIYSFAGSIKSLLNVISISLNTVWATWFFDKMEQNHVPHIRRKAKEYALLVLLLSVSALCVAPEVVKLLGPKEYWAARFLAPPMVLDSYVMFVYAIVVQAEYYSKQTHYVLIGTTIAAIINTTTNLIFINLYGYIAAAYTTLFAYVCYLVFHVIISKRAVGFHVISVPQHLFQGLVLVGTSFLCLLTMEQWVLRWGLMIIADILIATTITKMILRDGDLNLEMLVKKMLRR